MAIQFKNNDQLRRAMLPITKNVVEYVLKNIEEQNALNIEEFIYAMYEPTIYERTYEFQEAWEVTKPAMSGVHSKGEFNYASDKMNYSPGDAQHGSTDPAWGDARAYLADIIYQGLSGPKYGEGAWTHKRDAWSKLQLAIGNQLDQWIREGYSSQGVALRK